VTVPTAPSVDSRVRFAILLERNQIEYWLGANRAGKFERLQPAIVNDRIAEEIIEVRRHADYMILRALDFPTSAPM
jgi:hypothetical protein